MKLFFKKNWHIIFPSIIFLAYQFYISFLLWQRQGNIPPGFGDALAYIFNIKKVIRYKTLFPDIPYFSTIAHFTYLGYNLLLGSVGLIFKTTSQQVFFTSFFVGKIFLLASLIFFLKQIFPQQKKHFALSLLSLAFFVGDGSIHGFFWVVPSFLLLILFFVLLGLGFSKLKLKPLPLFLLILFYVSVHPMAVYTTAIFLLLVLFYRFFDKIAAQRFATISIFLIISAFLWQITIFSSLKKNNLPLVLKNINNVIHGLTMTQDDPGLGPSIEPKVINNAPNVSLEFFDNILKKHQRKIHQQLPSFIISWNSFFSWFFRFPPLLILIGFGIYSHIKNKKHKLLGLFITSLIFNLMAFLHPAGYRGLILLFPITIIFLSTSSLDLFHNLIKTKNKTKQKIKPVIIALFLFSATVGLIAFATYGIISIKYYSTLADYQFNSSECTNFIKSLPREDTQLVFTSIEGIVYFLNQDLEKYLLMGINSFKSHYYKKNLILITENYDQLKNTDIDMLLPSQNDDFRKIMTSSKKLTQYNCGIFQLIHGVPNTLNSP